MTDTMNSMNILSAAEMRACDRASTEQHGIASVDLMRHAAKAVADFTQLEFPLAKKITILCGRGNNGGDGLMAGRLLADAGLQVTTILLGDPEEMQGDAGTAYSELTNVAVIRSPEELQQHGEALNADLLLDAVLGTGFKPPMRDLPLAALHWLKSAPKLPPILAVDLPSGWNADSYEAQALDPVYPADAVITFTAPKPAHVFGLLTGSIVQPIVVSAIGSPDAAVISSLNLHWTGASKALTDKERPADSNKGMYGHVLVIGGSAGKSGAPAMASLAALRTGAGLVTAAVSPSVLPLVASVTPELMTQSLAVTDAGEIAKTNLDAGNLEKLLKGITLLAIGPGLGTSPDAVQFTIGPAWINQAASRCRCRCVECLIPASRSDQVPGGGTRADYDSAPGRDGAAYRTRNQGGAGGPAQDRAANSRQHTRCIWSSKAGERLSRTLTAQSRSILRVTRAWLKGVAEICLQAWWRLWWRSIQMR